MILPADDSAIARAAAVLRAGGLVAFPTETVYGLAADATNGHAVARIFEAKGRPRFNPLIVHVPHIEAAREIAVLGESAEALATQCWPGPLTLVLPLRKDARSAIHPLVTAGLDTVAVRVPAHPLALALLNAVGRPLAAPSANRSGHVSPTLARHVEEDLGDYIAMILDGGPTAAGIESTIVALTPRPVLLRPGAICREAIEEKVGSKLAAPADPGIVAPGQLASHYAPRASLRLNASAAGEGEVLLAFGRGAPDAALNLSARGDLAEAAANLFAYLRRLDAGGVARIAVMPIPDHDLGEAINDRLRRAAAPKT